MSNAVNPVIGNDGFNKIQHMTDHLSELNLTTGRVVDLSAGSVTTQVLNQAVVGLGTVWQVVGYAPTSFATGAINSVHFLNNSPASAAASAVGDSQLLLLPAGAQVLSVLANNNGTTVAGGTTFDVGTEVWSASPTGNANLLAAATLASLNAGVSAGNLQNAVTPVALGTVGAVINTAAAAEAANTGVTIQVLSVANTAGDAAVTVSYLL